MPGMKNFSDWDGTPFFAGCPEAGRHVYVDRQDEAFMAYGVIDPNPKYVFQIQGIGQEPLHHFLQQVKRESARVTHGPPPFEVKTGGDKPPTSDGPSGVKGRPPVKRSP